MSFRLESCHCLNRRAPSGGCNRNVPGFVGVVSAALPVGVFSLRSWGGLSMAKYRAIVFWAALRAHAAMGGVA